ncbi:hypothetical protein RFI_37441, partial [Reticulomyxa filosa]
TNQDNKEKELKAYVIINGKEKPIKMNELTFKELLHQSYFCLEATDFEKIQKENLKLQLIDMKDNIIESDEFVKKEFENNKPTFKILWIPLQQPLMIEKAKSIKNALV